MNAMEYPKTFTDMTMAWESAKQDSNDGWPRHLVANKYNPIWFVDVIYTIFSDEELIITFLNGKEI